MATTTAEKPTRWDMSNVYSGLEADDYRQAFADLERQVAAIETYCDEHQVRRLAEPIAAGADGADADGKKLVELIEKINAMSLLYDTVDAFVYAFVSTDSYNNVAQREQSKLELLDTRRQKLWVRLQGWIGSIASLLPKIVEKFPLAAEHRFFLMRTAEQSRHLMSEELEALAADLTVDGGGAFGKLQGNVTSQLKVPFERDGKMEELPITVVRNFCFDPDPELRRRGYEAELKGWHSIRTSVAASINSVKGTARTLACRRKWCSPLDESLEQNRIDRGTLDAMMDSIREAFPMFRRYLRAKAKKLGKEQLPWWDIFAPVGQSNREYSWREARDFIVEKFGTFHQELADYAARAFDNAWIDGEPRDGKRGGAFCMGVAGVEESRILANFDGSFEQVSTLAHELGHGYHNYCQRGLPMLRRGSPSTLAETASIFCETLIAEAAIAESEPAEQLPILEAQVAGATQVCVDISSRFIFESAVIERRANAELSPDELCELMKSAQAETYADGVDPATYHPYMWLWKPHYYSYGHNFYNYPYAFGHLFGLGLYAIYKQEGPSFVDRYRELLRSTGQDYAAPLAKRFGIDLRSADFWRASLAMIEDQAKRYEAIG